MNITSTNSENTVKEPIVEDKKDGFKKPQLLIGKIGRLPRKLPSTSPSSGNKNEESDNKQDKKLATDESKGNNSTGEDKYLNNRNSIETPQTESFVTLPYKEPTWSGLPESTGKPYKFEVLKNGTIIETIDLMKKPFYVFGRLTNCDICMQHPTVSRYHAVLQYRDVPSEDDTPGFYIYDLGSTHGTFLNGKNNKLKVKIYTAIKVGHMLRLGCSQRSFILTGPEDDQEEESELSVTELKQLREKKIKEYQEKMKLLEIEREERRKKEEERGVDWGIGDDADEDEDIGENPYASTTNEELYLDDPKKALKGFFEREGLELQYDCTEQGMGQFLCKVELPLDDDSGKPIVAEVLHRGKKKESVVQCALEACRILDRFGVLRQATHESKKRKARNWEDNDYYDSDEDTFLDRTGSIEKKREKRMKNKYSETAETYESLQMKNEELTAEINELERKLGEARFRLDEAKSRLNPEEDSLDSYMRELSEDRPDEHTISKLRSELTNLKKRHTNNLRLINIAKPASLPVFSSEASTSGESVNKKQLPAFGKRRMIPVKFPTKPQKQMTDEDSEEKNYEEIEKQKQVSNEAEGDCETKKVDEIEESENQEPQGQVTDDAVENEDIIEETNSPGEGTAAIPTVSNVHETIDSVEASTHQTSAASDSDSSEEEYAQLLRHFEPLQLPTADKSETFKLYQMVLSSILPSVAEKHRVKLLKIMKKLQWVSSTDDRLHRDWKALEAKKRKVMRWINDLKQAAAQKRPLEDKLEYKVYIELHRILQELDAIAENKFKIIDQFKDMGSDLKTITDDIGGDIEKLKDTIFKMGQSRRPKIPVDSIATDPTSTPSCSSELPDEDGIEESEEKKKKKNQKRNEQRQHKAEMERQKGYQEDASRENYNMWLPPADQSGDGRTNLNEKFGY